MQVLDSYDPAGLSRVKNSIKVSNSGYQPIAFDPVTHSAVRYAIDTNQPLLRAAAPVIQSLTRAMANTRNFAILTERHLGLSGHFADCWRISALGRHR